MELTHPVTGHQITVDDGSADFWKAAGFRADQESAPKKTPAKRATSSKKSSK
jgi:hypothetical protein